MTFIEVVLAIFIVGSVVSAVLLLQSNVLKNTFSFSSRAQRIVLLRDCFMQAALHRAKKEPGEFKPQDIPEPKTKFIYQLKKPSQDSSLKKFKNIMIERISAQWDYWGSSQQEDMISFIYKPEKKEA